MRLFYGFDCFDVAADLSFAQEKVIGISQKYSLVKRQNFHLTLLFLGDVSLEDAKELGSIFREYKPMFLQLNQIGLFKGVGGNIVWMGVEKNGELMDLATRLSFKALDLKLISRKESYTPHITLMRRQTFLDNKNLSDVSLDLRDSSFFIKAGVLYESVQTSRGVFYEKRELYPFISDVTEM